MKVTIMASLLAKRDVDVDTAHLVFSVQVFSVQIFSVQCSVF
ncbi:MAG TPA: hypothetical protein VJ304_00550 [Flavobacterium sp.]|nr:hypothetical protein [Flavobacterium sp.]